ncbi:MAG: nodulation protein NfeD [Nitrospirota bacterium]
MKQSCRPIGTNKNENLIPPKTPLVKEGRGDFRTNKDIRQAIIILAFILFSLFNGVTMLFAEEKGKIYVALYDSPINPVAAEFITKSIDEAARNKAQALIIQLDTPGGLDQSMRIIVKKITSSEIPVIVFVSPTGARAASAGVFITLAAHIAAMAPGTNIGAAHPVALGGGKIDEDMRSKIENDAVAYIKSIAEMRGKNVKWAEDAVMSSVSITEKEALELNVIDMIADDIDMLIKDLNGKKITINNKEHILDTQEVEIRRIDMGMRLRILNAISDPNIAFVLMSIGMIGLFFELSNPGLILPGVVGTISLILAFYSFQTLPINYAGLLLMILGIILFIAEVKVISYGLLTVGGIISMILGSIMLIDSDLPFLKISWSVILPVTVAIALFISVSLRLVINAHKKLPVIGQEGLIGMTGIASTDINGINVEGMVYLNGELWSASSNEMIKKGERIEVAEIHNLRLTVVKAVNSHEQ